MNFITKKSKLICAFLVSVILFSSLSISVNARERRATNLTVMFPSVAESTIAPERDFYVMGSIDGDSIPDDARLCVELFFLDPEIWCFRKIREVYSEQKNFQSGMHVNYQNLDYYGVDREALRESMMPDLVYDGVDINTFQDAWRKCYYSDKYYTALICGGSYSNDIRLVDEYGNALEPLVSGSYLIAVTAFTSNGAYIASIQHPITIGITPDKVLTRFSPQEHLDKVNEVAAHNDYRIYGKDPFPGIWDPSRFVPSLEGRDDLFSEIKAKWYLADLTEYSAGQVHFFIYNISPTSASYAVEIGILQYTHSVDNRDRLLSYYYDIGEPFLHSGNLEGQFLQFDPGSRLELTRVDYSDENTQDDYLDMDMLPYIDCDVDLSDGVEVQANQVISINGVVSPIQNNISDVSWESNNSFSINNHIATIEYTFAGENIYYTSSKDVGLTRQRGGQTFYSLLEFKHDFLVMEEWYGDEGITVSVQAYDVYGNPVSGTQKDFHINFIALSTQIEDEELIAA